MVSRRNYFSIVIMMAVLFFMFQFSQVIKESGNTYDVNEFVAEEGTLPSGADRWEPVTALSQLENRDYILFFGKEDEMVSVISQWCTYTKRNLMLAESVGGYQITQGKLPEMILVDSNVVNWSSEIAQVESLTKWGVPIVFCNLPEASVIVESDTLQQILGIEEVRSQATEVRGIRLFEGFLLGGEAVYEAKTEEENEYQDLNLTVPWYLPASGTKTYMVGIMNEAEVEREYFPSLIWRNSYEGTKIFAVEGDYMSTLSGLGILNAFVYELEAYQVYPIINSQVTMITNFPGFASENADKIMSLYSRSPKMVFRDIMWPSISAMTKTNDLKLTCFFGAQYDYQDGYEPVGDEVTFYLQQLKEVSSEAGISLNYKEGVTFQDVLKRDTEFYQSLESQYHYQAVFVEEKDLEAVEAAVGKSGLLKETRTLGCEWSHERPLVSYLTDEVTLQHTVGNAEIYSYSNHLEARSIQSALGYSNVLLNLQDALWPQDKEDQWENLYDEMSSNVKTYWSGDNGYEQTTLSESDQRVRTFLNLDYEESRNDNTLILEVRNSNQDSWFILRTHQEIISEIKGGEYQEVEEDVYLIHVQEPIVKIVLEPIKSFNRKQSQSVR